MEVMQVCTRTGEEYSTRILYTGLWELHHQVLIGDMEGCEQFGKGRLKETSNVQNG